MPDVATAAESLTPVEIAVPTVAVRVSERPRIAMIVGDQQTLYCGVKDYARCLAASLQNLGYSCDVFAPPHWKLSSLSTLQRILRPYDIVHVQYPSIGFRGSLLPHLLGLLVASGSTVVTLHEHSALPLAQRLSTHLFRWTTSAVILASGFEQTAFNHILHGVGAPQQIIPIGSNVPAAEPETEQDLTVIYFGQVRPRKGLEDFLELARLSLNSCAAFRFRLLGTVTRANEEYASSLRHQSPDNVEWTLNAPFPEIASVLSRAFAAYLPFPDGASDRRGSMLACFVNGLPVLSQVGEATTPAILEHILHAPTPAEALGILQQLQGETTRMKSLRESTRQFGKRFDWDEIARQHVNVYASVRPDFLTYA